MELHGQNDDFFSSVNSTMENTLRNLGLVFDFQPSWDSLN